MIFRERCRSGSRGRVDLLSRTAVSAFFAISCTYPLQSEETPKGVVVLSVDGSALEKAGLLPDDVLFGWRRLPSPPHNPRGSEGSIDSVFDWNGLQVEQAPRGFVILYGTRDQRELEVVVGPGEWRSLVMPVLPSQIDSRVGRHVKTAALGQKGGSGLGDGSFGPEDWQRLVDQLRAESINRLIVWALYELGRAMHLERDWEAARRAYKEALSISDRSNARAVLWQEIGRSYSAERLPQQAEASFRLAIEERRENPEHEISSAALLRDIGVAWYGIHTSLAERYWNEALELQRRYTPISLETASTLGSLGAVAWPRGRFDKAAEFFSEQLSLQKALDSSKESLHATMLNLAGALEQLDDLEQAEELRLEAMAIKGEPPGPGEQRPAPHSHSRPENLVPCPACQDELPPQVEKESLGVVIEAVEPESEVATTGLMPGDRVVAWEGSGSLGSEIRTIFDWQQLKTGLERQGNIVAIVQRGASSQRIDMPPGTWELSVRPAFRERELEVYRKGKAQLHAGNIHSATANWRRLLRSRQSLDGGVGCWLFQRIARAWQSREIWSEVRAAYSAGLEQVSSEECQIWLLLHRSDYYLERKKTREAISDLQRILEIIQRSSSSLLAEAVVYSKLGQVWLNASWRIAVQHLKRAAAIHEQQAPSSFLHGRTLAKLGISLLAGDQVSKAEEALEKSVAILSNLEADSTEMVESLKGIGRIVANRGEGALAVEYYRRALEACERLGSERCSVLGILRSLAYQLQRLGRTSQAREYLTQILREAGRLEPAGKEAVRSLRRLAKFELDSGSPEAAARHYRAANALLLRRAELEEEATETWWQLGHVAKERRDLKQAREHYAKALANYRSDNEYEKVGKALRAIASIDSDLGEYAKAYEGLKEARKYLPYLKGAVRKQARAAILNGIGLVEEGRGNSKDAVAHFEASLELYHEMLRFKDSGVVLRGCARDGIAAVNVNLGTLAVMNENLDVAKGYYRQSLDHWSKIRPRISNTSVAMNSLGRVALEQGRFSEAERFFRRAFAYSRNVVPDYRYASQSLHSLGRLAESRGEMGSAEDFYRRALSHIEDFNPLSLEAACLHNAIAKFLWTRGDLEAAKGHLQSALDIVRRSASGSLLEARVLSSMGDLFREMQEAAVGVEYHLLAVKALETQAKKVGPSLEGSYRSRHSAIYERALSSLVSAGRVDESLAVSEYFRGRSLLSLMDRRKVGGAEDLSLELASLAESYSSSHAKILEALSELDPFESRDETERLRERLSVVRRSLREIRALGQLSSVSAGVEPLGLEPGDIREVVEEGTVMLYYVCSGTELTLFVVRRGHVIRAERIELSVSELRNYILQYGDLLNLSREGPRSAGSAQLVALGRRLFRILVDPAQGDISGSRRILVVPDGPLHLLPFGALVQDVGVNEDGRGWRYLIEWKPVHSVLSAAVYSRAKAAGLLASVGKASESEIAFLGLGDPDFGEIEVGPALGDSGRHSGDLGTARLRQIKSWKRLYHSREEVIRIKALFQDGVSLLGRDANKEMLDLFVPRANIVHFATHGFLDEYDSLNSALILSPTTESRASGVLHLWEIVDDFELRADLVVLSACETAMGEEQGGEGLMGLSRAFLAAGARSVLATFWNIDDKASAELMVRFYENLLAGLAKDVALQQAQVSFLSRGAGDVEWAAPHYWAGFQLYGYAL